MGRKKDEEEVAVRFEYRETATGKQGRGVATGASVSEIAEELDALSKGGDVEVIDPRRVE